MAEQQSQDKSILHYNGKRAYEVYGYGDNDCDCVERITFDPSITKIGWSAFNGCKNVKEVTIPTHITTIGHCAFRGCINLTNVEIPSTVTTIEWGAFWDCPNFNQPTLQRINDYFIKQHNITRCVTIKQGPGKQLQFQGATQKGWSPNMWGITLKQMIQLFDEHPCIDEYTTMRQVVELAIKPITKDCGIGYALLLNQDKPLHANIMVSVSNIRHLQYNLLYSICVVGHSLTPSVLFCFASIACMG